VCSFVCFIAFLSLLSLRFPSQALNHILFNSVETAPDKWSAAYDVRELGVDTSRALSSHKHARTMKVQFDTISWRGGTVVASLTTEYSTQAPGKSAVVQRVTIDDQDDQVRILIL
jgi:hypothetical protein